MCKRRMQQFVFSLGSVGGAGISLGESRTVRCGNTLHCLKLMVPFFLLGAVGQLLEHNCKSYEDEGICSLLCQS